MIGVWVLALAAASSLGAAPPGRPAPGVLRRAFEAGQRSLVEVSSKRGNGPGIVVGANGEVLTYVGFVELQTAQVRFGDEPKAAKVRCARADLGVAVLALVEPQSGVFPAVAVYSGEQLPEGFVLGLGRKKKGKVVPKLGSIRSARGHPETPGFFSVDVELPLGSPVLDLKGRLLGMVMQRLPNSASRVVSVRALQSELAESPL